MIVESVVIATAAFAAFRLRQALLRAGFKRENLESIEEENLRIVEAWRATDPYERKLIIDRTFKPADHFLMPEIRVKRKYKRDSRSLLEKIFG